MWTTPDERTGAKGSNAQEYMLNLQVKMGLSKNGQQRGGMGG